MLPWIECPTIDVDLADPIGERYRHLPAEVFEKGRRLLGAIMAEAPPAARFLADVVRVRTGNRFQREAVALGESIGGSWREIMIANVIYDLALATLGCSTIVLPTPAGPVLARNMDWWPEEILAQTSYMVRVRRNGRLEYAHAGWPGTIGIVTGMSRRGFAIALNAVQCPEGIDKFGYPVLLHLRRVIEDAGDFATAVRMLSEQRLAAPGLLTVVGRENDQRVVIERTSKHHGHRWGNGDKPLLATNHYRFLREPILGDSDVLDETSCDRFDALAGFFTEHTADQPVEEEALLYALTDPTVMQDITAQHVIIRPRTQEMRLFVPRRLMGS